MPRKLSDYGPTIENWLREFIDTMDSDPEIGDRSGDEPLGVKIMFDGYGYNEETDEEDDTNLLKFAVFVHKDSLSGKEFPEHEVYYGVVKNRPDEEVCIHCYYDVEQDFVGMNSFEDTDTTLDHQMVYRLIRDLELEKYKS